MAYRAESRQFLNPFKSFVLQMQTKFRRSWSPCFQNSHTDSLKWVQQPGLRVYQSVLLTRAYARAISGTRFITRAINRGIAQSTSPTKGKELKTNNVFTLQRTNYNLLTKQAQCF